MSDMVTGKVIRRGWGIKWMYGPAAGAYSVEVLSGGELERRRHSINAAGGTVVPVAIIELPSAPAPTARVNDMASIGGKLPAEETDAEFIDQIKAESSPPWPPKWGEGAGCGYCRRKTDGIVFRYQMDWEDRIELTRGTWANGSGYYLTPEAFAAEFEPI